MSGYWFVVAILSIIGGVIVFCRAIASNAARDAEAALGIGLFVFGLAIGFAWRLL